MTDLVKGVYINPYSDFGFKKLFCTEYNKDLLIAFLNALLTPQSPIEDLSYQPQDSLPDSKEERLAIFDVYCMLQDGSRIIVEMQNSMQEYFKDRSLYYATFPIREQAEKGPWKYELAPVYTVGVMNFTFDEREEYFHHEVVLFDRKTKEQFYDKLCMIYLEMPKFNKQPDELRTELDRWLYVIKNLARLSERPKVLEGKIFEHLFEVARIAAITPEDREEYQLSLKRMWDNEAAMTTQRNLGLAEGLAKGKAEGLAEGKAQGIEIGEARSKREIARGMKAKGYANEEIHEITGLSLAEIEAL